MKYSKKTYYAHSMIIYGSERETEERDLLTRMGFNILCPKRDLSLGNDMNKYLEVVGQCKDLVCSEFAGFVGKGVYLEVKHAMDLKKPAYVLRKGVLYEVVRISTYNTDDYKTTYGQIKEVKEIE